MSEKVTIASVEINVLYMGALALDLILRDAERRMRAQGGEFKHEKKQLFNRFTKAVKEACILVDQLNEDVINSTEKSHFKDYNVWQAESNELARLILTFADKASEEGATESIFNYIGSFKGAGIITKEALERFYLK